MSNEVRQLCVLGDLRSNLHVPRMHLEEKEGLVSLYVYGTFSSYVIRFNKSVLASECTFPVDDIQVSSLDDLDDEHAVILDIRSASIDLNVTFGSSHGHIWSVQEEELFKVKLTSDSYSQLSTTASQNYSPKRLFDINLPVLPRIISIKIVEKNCVIIRDGNSSWIIEVYKQKEPKSGNFYLYDRVMLCRGRTSDENATPVIKYIKCVDSPCFGEIVIAHNLFKMLFGEEMALKKCSIALIGLPDGQAYSYSYSSAVFREDCGESFRACSDDCATLICCMNQPIVGMFSVLSSSITLDRGQDCIVICGKLGSINIIHNSSSNIVEVTEMFLQEPILTCNILNEQFVYSNGSCVKSLAFSANDISKTLKEKGILPRVNMILDIESIILISPFAPQQDGNRYIILLNQDGCIMVLRLPLAKANKIIWNKNFDDKDATSIIQKMGKCSQDFQEINILLAEQKKIINSLAVAAGALNDNCSFHICCRLNEYCAELPLSLEVTIKNLSPFTFCKNYWSFRVVLKLDNPAKTKQAIKIIPLTTDLHSGDSIKLFFSISNVSPLALELPVEVLSAIQLALPRSYFFQDKVQVTKSSDHEMKVPLLIFKLPSSIIDILDLVKSSRTISPSPESLTKTVWDIAQQKECFKTEFLSNLLLPMTSSGTGILTIAVGKQLINACSLNHETVILQRIFNNNENADTDIRQVKAFLAEFPVNFTVQEKAQLMFITCESENILLLAALRRAILKRLKKSATCINKGSLRIPYSCLKAAQAIAVELKRLSANSKDFFQLLHIYKRLREDIFKQLPLL